MRKANELEDDRVADAILRQGNHLNVREPEDVDYWAGNLAQEALCRVVARLRERLREERAVGDTLARRCAQAEALAHVLRQHMLCAEDVEIKTIGNMGFDPREHCSRCRLRAEAERYKIPQVR